MPETIPTNLASGAWRRRRAAVRALPARSIAVVALAVTAVACSSGGADGTGAKGSSAQQAPPSTASGPTSPGGGSSAGSPPPASKASGATGSAATAPSGSSTSAPSSGSSSSASSATPTTLAVTAWASAPVIAALAPIAAPDAQVVVTQLDGAQLISPVTDAAAPAPASTYDHGLIEPDGRVSLAPAAAVPAGYPTAVRAGNSIVVATSSTDAPPTVARHRLGTDGWEPVAIDAPAGSFILLTAMGDAVLATAVGPLDAVGGGRETSVVIGADGAARKVAAPPDPNASPAGGFTVWTGSKLLVMARDSAADDRLLRRPYAFDPASGEWKALALPDWVTCRDDCGWYGPHQGGDSFLLVWTGTEVVLHAFVGGPGVDRTMTGAYDPSADRWRKLDDPPMPLELAHAIVARGVVRAVPTSSFRQEHPDHAGVLDLATGRWSTEAIPVATAGRSGDAPGVLEIRQTVGKTMASAYSMGEPVPTVAQAVFDETSARWRAAGAGDQLAWRRLANGTVTLQDLAG